MLQSIGQWLLLDKMQQSHRDRASGRSCCGNVVVTVSMVAAGILWLIPELRPFCGDELGGPLPVPLSAKELKKLAEQCRQGCIVPRPCMVW